MKYIESIDGKDAIFYVDSNYVKLGITEWIPNWINPKPGKKAWTTSNNKPVKNKELWLELYSLNSKLNIQWRWVKGHSGDHYNEIVDTEVVRVRNEIK